MYLRYISLLAVLIVTPLIWANEHNYDSGGGYRPFNWNKNNCGSTAEKVHQALEQKTSLDLSYLKKEWKCPDLGELRNASILAVKRVQDAAKALADYRNNCLCSSYVALRLHEEGFDSARSGGEVLNFKKATAAYEDAKALSSYLAKQLSALADFEDVAYKKGIELCKYCMDPAIRNAHCLGYGDGTSGRPVMAAAANTTPYKDYSDFLLKVGGHTFALRQRMEKDVESLASPSKPGFPGPECADAWGPPNSCTPELVASGTSHIRQPWKMCAPATKRGKGIPPATPPDANPEIP